jgi:hypothetical protein
MQMSGQLQASGKWIRGWVNPSRQGRCREPKNLAVGSRTLIPWLSNTWCNRYTISVPYKLDEEHDKTVLVYFGVSTTNVGSSKLKNIFS